MVFTLITYSFRNKHACIQCIYNMDYRHRNNSNQSKDMHVPQVCLNGGLQFNNYTNVWIVCTGTNMYSIRDSLLGTLAKEQ